MAYKVTIQGRAGIDYLGNVPQELCETEKEIMLVLCEYPNIAITRAELLRAIGVGRMHRHAIDMMDRLAMTGHCYRWAVTVNGHKGYAYSLQSSVQRKREHELYQNGPAALLPF